MRINGAIRFVDDAPVSESQIARSFPACRISRRNSRSRGSLDIGLSASIDDEQRRGFRFRVNIHRQRGLLAASIRVLPTRISSLAQLKLPESSAS